MYMGLQDKQIITFWRRFSQICGKISLRDKQWLYQSRLAYVCVPSVRRLPLKRTLFISFRIGESSPRFRRTFQGPVIWRHSTCYMLKQLTLRWRHNERDSVSNHQPHDCLLNRIFRRRSKKSSKLRVTGLCVGNSPGTGEFPAQMTSYAENVFIWWRHHEQTIDWVLK